MVHDWVGSNRQANDVHKLNTRGRSRTAEECVQCRPYDLGHLSSAFRVHQEVRDPAHQVFTEANLWIHDAIRN